MPGLSFLSKKSWHTSNIKNMEKVWIAEQKADQERKKLEDLQKQLLEERQIQELRQLQVAHGQVVKTVDTTLDWMYEGPASNAIREQQSEEYLLGKIYKSNSDNKTFSLVDSTLTAAAVNSSNSGKWMEKISTKTDMFARKHEDPFLMIKQREKEQRDKVINNPIQMEKIRQSIAKSLTEPEEEKDMQRRAKKELEKRRKAEKREKKDKKHRRRDGDRDNAHRSESSASDSDDHSRGSRDRPKDISAKRRRSSSTQDAHRSAEQSQSRRERTDRQSRDRDRQPTGREDRIEDDRDRRRDSRDRTSRQDSRSRRFDERDRSKPRSSRDDHLRDRTRYERDEDRRERVSRDESALDRDSTRESHSRGRPEDRDDARDVPRYGLVSRSAYSKQSTGDHLGPRPDLLRKVQETREREIHEKLHRQREDVTRLTEDEKNRRLAAMEAAAEVMDSARIHRHANGTQ